ncbi:MAG: ICEBs1 excisionase [Lachnospiraceae bacterium]|nr:ICEBs1 excisionase [Lachnospiraceae bacterium]
MEKEDKIYINAPELSKMLDISLGYAYKIIRRMNKDLEKQGFLVISGKVPRKYFEQHWFGLCEGGG